MKPEFKELVLKSQLFDQSTVSNLKGNVFSLEQYLQDKKYWRKEISVFFDGYFYVTSNPDLESYGHCPVIHYIKWGFYEGRSPSKYIDMEYILQQLCALRRLPDRSSAIKALKDFSGLVELLNELDISPSPFFDNDFFRKDNKLDGLENIPIEYAFKKRFINEKGNEYLEVSPYFSLKEYAAQSPDVVKSGMCILGHLIYFGCNDGRISRGENSVDPFYLERIRELYFNGENQVSTFQIVRTALAQGLALDSSSIKKKNPALKHESKDKKRVMVGCVLYKNTEAEVYRLIESFNREKIRTNLHELGLVFIANDGEQYSYTKMFPEIQFIDNQENLGFGAAHNVLMNHAFQKNDLYIGVNPDGYFLKESIANAINFSDFYNDKALIELINTPIEHPKWFDPNVFDTNWVSGAAFLISKYLHEKTHGFDENIHMYCEDVDLSWRVKSEGLMLKVCPTARFQHDVTDRFYTEENNEFNFRRKLMLEGTLALACRWGEEKAIAKYSNELVSEGFYEHMAEVPKPAKNNYADHNNRINNFAYGLRFSYSRYWN